MGLLDIIPNRFKPNSLRSDVKAVEEFKKGMTDQPKKASGRKRISQQLTYRRQFIAEMKQDELKLAILWAEDPIRPRREFLLELYRMVIRDCHLEGEIGKSINKVIGAPWGVFKKGSEEVDIKATRLLQKTWFEDYRTFFEEARLYGHSLVQFLDMIPSTEEGMKMEFKAIDLIDRPHVRPEDGFIVFDISDDIGIPFRDDTIRKQLQLIEMGKPKDLGILLKVAKEFIWKNFSRADWSRLSEKWGDPILTIKTDTDDKNELDQIEKNAMNFGKNLYYIGPPEDEVDTLDPRNKDSHKIYQEQALFCNDEISKAISWQTGTSDEKSFVGSAEVHERVLNDYVDWRKRKQAYHINEDLFPFLIDNGYPFKDCEFRYIIPKDQQEEDKDNTPSKSKGRGGDPAKKSEAKYRYRM